MYIQKGSVVSGKTLKMNNNYSKIIWHLTRLYSWFSQFDGRWDPPILLPRASHSSVTRWSSKAKTRQHGVKSRWFWHVTDVAESQMTNVAKDTKAKGLQCGKDIWFPPCDVLLSLGHKGFDFRVLSIDPLKSFALWAVTFCDNIIQHHSSMVIRSSWVVSCGKIWRNWWRWMSRGSTPPPSPRRNSARRANWKWRISPQRSLRCRKCQSPWPSEQHASHND